MAIVRLQKLLSERGVASRRKAEELIAGGHVKVNGHVASLGEKVDDLMPFNPEEFVRALF